MRTRWPRPPLLLLVAFLLVPSAPLPATAQTIPQEQHIVRLSKNISHISWIDEKTLLATLRGAGFITSEIVLISLPSGEVRTLERGACASPSPDRTRVGYIPGPAYRGEVWILDLRSNNRRQLTTGLAARCLAWSPDGRRIAALVTSQTSRFGDDFLILSAESGRAEHLIGAGQASLDDPSWSPDAQRLAFSVSASMLISLEPLVFRLTVSLIELFDLRDRRRTLLFDLLPENTTASDLAFSPDGRTLLFVSRGPGGPRIRAHGGSSSTVVAEGHSPAWHPDGRSIVFARGYDCPPFPCAGDDLYVVRFP